MFNHFLYEGPFDLAKLRGEELIAEAARERLAQQARRGIHDSEGSDAPLRSTFSEWRWRNPLNLIPLTILVLVITGLTELVLGL